MIRFWERWDEILPELLGEDLRKAREVRRDIIKLAVAAGRKLLLEYSLPERWSYIIESDDEEEERALRIFLAAVDEPTPEILRLFENLTEYETEYWLRYQERIRQDWTAMVDGFFANIKLVRVSEKC